MHDAMYAEVMSFETSISQLIDQQFQIYEDINSLIPNIPNHVTHKDGLTVKFDNTLDIPVKLWNTDFDKLDEEQENLMESCKCSICKDLALINARECKYCEKCTVKTVWIKFNKSK